MLAPTFHVVTALDKMQPALIAPVRAGVKASLAVERYAKCVPSAFCEELELVRHGMIAPDRLAEETNAAHSGSASAALRAVQPAVWSPGQAVRNGVGVFEAEAFEVYFGGAVRHVVAVP